jgi:hypothetical protein
VVGRQGGKREINECYRKTELGNVIWRPEKGHLTPEVRADNKMTCDYVWDKVYSPISVTCSKWYIRKAPFVLGAHTLDSVH